VQERRPVAFSAFLAPLRNSKWVVYCKRLFGGPREVLRHLARYIHRVAISNRRLVAADETASPSNQGLPDRRPRPLQDHDAACARVHLPSSSTCCAAQIATEAGWGSLLFGLWLLLEHPPFYNLLQ
jgi:Putative transposase